MADISHKILLTGASGFLGSHIAHELFRRGYDVIAIKRQGSDLGRLRDIKRHICFYDLEQLEHGDFLDCLRGVEGIIHLATCHGRNGESLKEIYSSNVLFPLVLLEKAAGCGIERFINVSTALPPRSGYYALSKKHFEDLGRVISKTMNMRFTNIRLELVYGPNDSPHKFVANLINNCLENTSEVSLTLGHQQRDFVYVEDAVSALMCIMDAGHNDLFRSFDVGSGEPVTIRKFAELVKHISNSKVQLNFGAIPYKDSDVMYSCADIKDLEELGWRAKIDLNEGIKKCVDVRVSTTET